MYDEIIQFLRKLSILWQVHKWNVEAQRALRASQTYRAITALERVDALNKMI